MSTEQTQWYKASRTVITLKYLMNRLEALMPPSAFQKLYDFAFQQYRLLLRVWYARRLLLAVAQGNPAKIEKSTVVLQSMPFSLVGASGLEATYDIVRQVEERAIAGAIVELGVAQGGSAALMAQVVRRFGTRRHIWLFDSYEGLPAPTEDDFVDGATGLHVRELPVGSCLGLQEQVEELLFEKLQLDPAKLTLVKGWFEDTVASNVENIGAIAVLRIDADWYDSVKCCLENLYDSVVSGGYIIVDDYGTCFGAKKAVDEFLADRSTQVSLIPDGRGGVSFVKPAQ